jgi:hypothetical protein
MRIALMQITEASRQRPPQKYSIKYKPWSPSIMQRLKKTRLLKFLAANERHLSFCRPYGINGIASYCPVTRGRTLIYMYCTVFGVGLRLGKQLEAGRYFGIRHSHVVGSLLSYCICIPRFRPTRAEYRFSGDVQSIRLGKHLFAIHLFWQ